MKDKILEILKNSERSMDATEIMTALKTDYSKDDLVSLLKELNDLCMSGDIYLRNDNKYMLFERSSLKKGYIEIAKKGYGFLLCEPEDLYIREVNLNGASDGDFVIVEPTKGRGRKSEYRVLRILRRGLDNTLGEIIVDSKGNFQIKPLKEANYSINLLYNDESVVEGSIVKFEIVNEKSKKSYDVKITKIVGHKNSPDIDTLKIIEEFNIVSTFSEDALKEASSISQTIDENDIKNRIDLRNETIFTIDGIDTKDIDDAISVEILENGNFKLGVHIADVSYYVKEGSALKKDAFEKGNSVYLADRVVPMLPVELSNGICSLNPNSDRFTTSCVMEVDNKGNVVSYDIFKGIINSKRKMNYKEVNKTYEGKSVEYKYLDYVIKKGDTKESISFKYGMTTLELEEFNEGASFEEETIIRVNGITILNNMLKLSQIIRANKERRGQLDFISSEVKLIVDENGKVTDIQKREEGLGENMIEDFMVIANETVATHIYNMALPFIYRVHATPSPLRLKEFMSFVSVLGHTINGKIHYENTTPKEIQRILNDLKDTSDYEVLNKKMLRCMSKAVYDPINIGHFGIASTCYTHFTSPIRRYSDLMVHFYLDEYLFKNNMNVSFIESQNHSLPFICEHISKTERTAEDCEYEVNDMKIAEYMESHIGDEFDAKIDGCLTNGFFIETDNLITGLVSLDTYPEYLTYREELMSYVNKKNRVVFRLGDKVRVKCISASKENRTVDFMVVR